VSCGKEVPTFKSERFVNNLNIKKSSVTGYEIENFHPIKGVITINTDWRGKESQQTEFESITDLGTHINKLLTVNSKFLTRNRSFDERMKIFFKQPISFFEQLNHDKEYEVMFNFSSLPKERTKLLFINSETERDLGFVESDTKLLLTGKDLINLFKNEASIIVVKNQDPSIELIKNYYRIYYKNQDDSSVVYVSQQLAFEDFLRLNQIDHARNIENINLLTTQPIKSLESWWFKKMPNGDYVLLYGDIPKIQQNYLKTLLRVPFSLIRHEGRYSISSIAADTDSRLLFHLEGQRIMRVFDENRVFIPQFKKTKCFCDERKEKGEIKEKIDLGALSLIEFNPDEIQQKRIQELGTNHFEIIFQLKKDSSSLILGLPEINNKLVLGPYLFVCNGKVNQIDANKISPEKLFELKGEAFVERRHLSF
jgi:hypothetical protein